MDQLLPWLQVSPGIALALMWWRQGQTDRRLAKLEMNSESAAETLAYLRGAHDANTQKG